MKKYLNTLFTGLMFFNFAVTQSDTSITSLEKKIIKTIGDFNGDGIIEEAVYNKGRIEISNNLQSINGVTGCDSLYVKKDKKDFLIIHYKDGKMEKAEYYPEDEFWGRTPQK